MSDDRRILKNCPVSCFADEIDSSVDRQMALMEELGIGWVEFRSGDGKGVADYTEAEAETLMRRLEEKKIRKPNGKNFPNTSINRIIKNPIYTGVIRNGDAQSAFIPELQIIDQETFDRAHKIMSDRTTHHAETPLNLK